jgi:Ca2+-binding EF-hand superfamily protein
LVTHRFRIASKSFAVVAPIAAGWLVSFARADDKPVADAPDTSAMFSQLDSNHDGQLTADEIPDDKKRLFERLVRVADKNKDGKLSAEELAAGLKPRERPAAPGGPGSPEGRPGLETMFKRLDANGDGKVTLDEVPEPRRERFKQLIARGDRDGDGALSEQEFIAAGPGAGAGSPDATQGPEGGGDVKRLFSRLDKNGDGKVTLDEVPEERRPRIERWIRRADKDGDKALSLEEFTAAWRQGRPGEDRPESGRRPPFPSDRGLPFPSLFSALDSDHDGKLSAAEISAASEVIRKLDKNADGFVTPDEVMSQTPETDGKDK